MIEIGIEASGIYGNPFCRITYNGTVIFDDIWGEGKTLRKFLVDDLKDNIIIIEHHSKRFGENRVWDKQELHIHDIYLDDVGIKFIWQIGRKYYIHQDQLIEDPLGPVDMIFGYNGKVELNFKSPVYDWIIEERGKKVTKRDLISILDSYNDPFIDDPKVDALLNEIQIGIDTL